MTLLVLSLTYGNFYGEWRKLRGYWMCDSFTSFRDSFLQHL